MSKAETTSRIRYSSLISIVTAAGAGVTIGVALSTTTPIPGVTEVSEVVSVGIPAVRVLLQLAAVTTIGAGLLPLLIGPERPTLGAKAKATSRAVGLAGSLSWAVAALGELVLLTVEFRPQAKSINLSDIADYVARIGSGKALLVVAVLALGNALLWSVALRRAEKVPAEILVGLGLLTLLPLPVTGHAANSSYYDYTMVSLELHVLSAVAWCGGLAAMAMLAHNRSLLAQALPRFSRLATFCLLISVATGLFNGFIQLWLRPGIDFWTVLFTTAYGQLLLLKGICAGLIGLSGAYIRWRLLPHIVLHRRASFAAWTALELSVMGLTFGFAVALTRAPIG